MNKNHQELFSKISIQIIFILIFISILEYYNILKNNFINIMEIIFIIFIITFYFEFKSNIKSKSNFYPILSLISISLF
ncbi:MAG: hypothetical protein KC589_10835, partial [Nanoarchaeota archaeon]|nr:hypothetical protein [Nanoarchaeota archaeon]